MRPRGLRSERSAARIGPGTLSRRARAARARGPLDTSPQIGKCSRSLREEYGGSRMHGCVRRGGRACSLGPRAVVIGLSALWLGASAGAAPAAGAATATFGKTTVGASSDYFVSERKRMNAYALPEAGSVTKLSVYLAPTSTSGQ